jgi:hypothetical protein
LEVRSSNRGDHRYVRTHQFDQRRDLAGMVHADLEHAELGIARHPRQHQRHAPVIIEAFDRGVRLTGGRERGPDGFLGRGLAGAAGHRDNLRPAAGSGSFPQRDKSFQRVGNDDQVSAAVPGVEGLRHQRCRRSVGQRGTDEVMAVEILALDGDEQRLRRYFAGIDGDAGDRPVREPFGAAAGCRDDLGNGPK